MFLGNYWFGLMQTSQKMKFCKLYSGKTLVIPTNFFCLLMMAEGAEAAKCSCWSYSLQYSVIFSILYRTFEVEVGLCAGCFMELSCYSIVFRTILIFKAGFCCWVVGCFAVVRVLTCHCVSGCPLSNGNYCLILMGIMKINQPCVVILRILMVAKSGRED